MAPRVYLVYCVQPKMPIQATLNAYPDWQIPGEVIAIIPTADRSKATVKVRVALNTKDQRIVPDMGVYMRSKSCAMVLLPEPEPPTMNVRSLLARKSVTLVRTGACGREG